MHLYFHLFGLSIPAYGSLIALGLVLANLMAWVLLKKRELDPDDFLILEGYALLGGLLGAKLLYFFVSRNEIDWSRIFEFSYLSELMKSGFVFYGGLIGSLFTVFLAGKIHKIKVENYVSQVIVFIPFIHGFGRLGCFMAGCCYGIPWDGPFAVTFPEGSMAPSGISLFPVQLVEAIFLFVIFGIELSLLLKKNFKYTVELYILLYAILRFIMEFFRYDSIRGFAAGISTSQWICIGCFALSVVWLLRCIRKKANAGHGNVSNAEN